MTITVNETGNQTPVLAAIGSQATTEDINLNFVITATDIDATTPTLSATNLPSGASFTDNGDGSGSFDWIPSFTQSGIYNVTFFASDGFLVDSEVVTITVNEIGNQAPVLGVTWAQPTTEDHQL